MIKALTTFVIGTVFIVSSVSFASDYRVGVLKWQIDNAQLQVEANIAELAPGDKLEVDYSGTPIWVYRRTSEEVDFISENYSGADNDVVDAVIKRIEGSANSTSSLLIARKQLLDQPELEKNPYRSKHEEYFVFESTGRYGCKVQMEIPSYLQKANGAKFFDPCTGDLYDLAGRFIDTGAVVVFQGSGRTITPEPQVFPRLRIPPHQYKSDRNLSIGVSDIDALPEILFSEEELYFGLTPTETLLQATALNDLSRAHGAVKAGADVNSPGVASDSTGSLPLFRATLYSSVDMVEFLMAHGAVPGKDEIYWAKKLNRHDVIRLLEASRKQ